MPLLASQWKLLGERSMEATLWGADLFVHLALLVFVSGSWPLYFFHFSTSIPGVYTVLWTWPSLTLSDFPGCF